jgi:hypothetical protein
MFDALEGSGIIFSEADVPSIQAVLDGLLFPLYPFDLRNSDNFLQFPPPDDPEF